MPSTPGFTAAAPAVAGRLGKDFLIVWEAAPVASPRETRIRGQLISRLGGFLQRELVLSAGSGVAHNAPKGAGTPERGGWLVVWSTSGQGGRTVDGRSFDALANPLGPVVRFSQGQTFPIWFDLAVVVAPNGRALVGWVGNNDLRQVGIRARAARSPVRK